MVSARTMSAAEKAAGMSAVVEPDEQAGAVWRVEADEGDDAGDGDGGATPRATRRTRLRLIAPVS